MSFTHSTKTTLSDGSVPSPSGTTLDTGGQNIQLDQNVPASSANLPYTVAFAHATIQSIFLASTKDLTIKTNGTNAVQTLTISGTPTGGTFTCTFGAQTTAGIAYNAIASAVQAALQAISSIGAGGITCTGGPLPGTPVVCTFAGAKGLASQSTITCTSGGLTGGSTPTASVSSTTSGVAPSDTINLKAGNPLQWSESSSYFACPFTADVTKLSFTVASAAAQLVGRILTT